MLIVLSSNHFFLFLLKRISFFIILFISHYFNHIYSNLTTNIQVMAFIRSISGIRATEGDGLNISVLSEYLISFGNLYGQGGIVFGRDGRSSGFWLEKLLMTAFESLGIPYLNIGIAPTPTIMLMVEKFGFTGGISITASHNPSQWNGLKFINSTGVFLNQNENNKLWNLVDNKIYSLNKIETKINTQV